MSEKFKDIAIAVALVVIALSGPAYFVSAQTQIPSGMPFGGYVGAFVPSSPVCPFAHSLILDMVSFTTIGVAVIPGTTQVYLNGNVTIPGAALLGTYIPAPLPCLLPYPVVRIVQVGTS